MPVLCLVPTAQRAARVARRLCDAEDGVLLGARVTTLDAVAGLVLASGDRRPVLSPLAERLLCEEVATAAPLLAPATTSPGALRALQRCLGELREAEITADQLRSVAPGLPAPGAARVLVLADVLRAYEERLGRGDLLDRPAALRAAADRLERRGGNPGELAHLDLLVVDGFAALPPAALDLALALTARARRVQWRVPYFPRRADLSAMAEPLVRRIEALHHVGGEPIDLALEDVDDPARAPRLAAALRTVFGGGAVAPHGGTVAAGGRIVVAAGRGEEGEAEVAAAWLSRLVEGGFAPEEVVLLAASSDAAERACRAADELHLPLHGRPRRSLGEEEPVRAILAALEAAGRPRRSALEAVLASPYLHLARVPSRTDFWFDRAGATDERGDPRLALRRRAGALTSPRAAPERAALLRVADALDDVTAELSRLRGAAPAREHAARLRGFIAHAGVRRQAARGDPELAARDLRALTRIEEVADEVVRALAVLGRGAEAFGVDRWAALLSGAAAQGSLPSEGDAARGIEVTAVRDAPGLSARAAVLVGAGRGMFPEPPTRDALLGDAERLAINTALRRPGLATSGSRAALARHAAFAALAAPREVLCVTWPGPGPAGAGRGAAPVVAELGAFAEEGERGEPGWLPPPRRSVRGAVRVLAAAGSRATTPPGSVGPQGSASGSVEALDPSEALRGLQARAFSVRARAAVERERQAAVESRSSSRFAGAIPAPLLGAYRELLPVQWTPSQLEQHATCPFRFFVGTVLAATEPVEAEPDIDPRDEGSLAHAVLERFHRDRIASGRARLLGTAQEREELAATAGRVFASFEADGRTGDPAVWASRRGVVLQRLERVIEEEARLSGDVVPVLVEHRFGGEDGAPPLVFGEGEGQVQLRGRIDRVDAAADRLVVIDYKDSRSATPWREKLRREAMGEVNFQLPAYLMAAAEALPGRRRLEATYLLLRSPERLPPLALEFDDPLLALDAEGRARARVEGCRPFADAVVEAVAAIRAGTLPIASRDCSRCAYGAVCRFQSRAEEEP